MDSETHLLSVTVLSRDFVCSGITVFIMAFLLEKSLDFCGLSASKSVTQALAFSSFSATKYK